MVRPERFELPTFWFVARRSIQLSYGRTRVQADSLWFWLNLGNGQLTGQLTGFASKLTDRPLVIELLEFLLVSARNKETSPSLVILPTNILRI
jgi:hypothetical protein